MRSNARRSAPVLAAAAAALTLSACSATHVGESWQCPLAQGSSCTSIADADPAVSAGAVRAAVLFGEPLARARRQAGGEAAGGWRDKGEACDGGCGFFAWFRELFEGDTDPHAPGHAPAAPATAVAAEPATGQNGEVPAGAPAAATAVEASLRIPEVLGRIWIAPFVDADGIYREAHWVRVVLAPAGWKLP